MGGHGASEERLLASTEPRAEGLEWGINVNSPASQQHHMAAKELEADEQGAAGICCTSCCGYGCSRR